jgi:hypothetical protein
MSRSFPFLLVSEKDGMIPSNLISLNPVIEYCCPVLHLVAIRTSHNYHGIVSWVKMIANEPNETVSTTIGVTRGASTLSVTNRSPRDNPSPFFHLRLLNCLQRSNSESLSVFSQCPTLSDNRQSPVVNEWYARIESSFLAMRIVDPELYECSMSESLNWKIPYLNEIGVCCSIISLYFAE